MQLRDIGIAVFVMVIWGGNFTVAKFGLAQIPPLTFMAMRFAVVAALLVPFVRLPRDKIIPVFWYSVTLGGIHFGLMFWALTQIDAATAALASQMGVPFATILSAFVFKDYPGIWRVTGILIAFSGVFVIAGEPRFEGGLLPLLTVVAAAFAWALGAVQAKAMGKVNGFALNGYMALFSVPQLIIWSLFFEQGQLDALLNADWIGWGSIFYQSLLVVIVGYGLWYHLLGKYPVSLTMPFTLLMPFFGVLFAVWLLDEALTLPMLIGGGLTILGVGVIVLRSARPKHISQQAATTVECAGKLR